MDDWQGYGFGLYIHWPFCQAKCPYCDFNSYVVEGVDHDAWTRAFLSELERYSTLLPNRILNSIFFGGGTPSLMHVETVARIIESAAKHWRFANDIEITLEANPTSVEAERFSGYRDAGVGRISLGVQALNDIDLQQLGRLHTVAETYQAIDIARKNFDSCSFDLIYARQNQSLEAWQKELGTMLDFAPDHLSLYQLTIEPNTAFGMRAQAGKLLGLPAEGLAADMYEMTQEMCSGAGMARYEVSNHARTGHSSKHNMIYWTCGDFIGIGPGAHGRIMLKGRRCSTDTLKSPKAWLNAVLEKGSGEKNIVALSKAEQAHEYLMMGLRLCQGIHLAGYKDIMGRDLIIPETLIDHELICIEGDRLRTTESGNLLLNSVLAALCD